MQDALPALILCLLVVVGIGTCVATSRQNEPPTADSDHSRDDRVEIPGIEWAALGAWARDHMAVKGSEGEWVGLDDLLANLETFIQSAGRSGAEESIETEHLRVLIDGVKQWSDAREERPELLWNAILKASDEPERWGRLMGALGPGLMAGAHEIGLEARPELVESMRQVQADLADSSGEARVTLEKKRLALQEAIATIDRIPAPGEAARERWENIKRLFRKKPEADSRAEEPSEH